MVSIILVPFFCINMLKDLFFLGGMFFLSKEVMFLLFIFPLIIFLIKNCLFASCESKDISFHFFSYVYLSFFLFLCFCSSSPFMFLFFLECCVFLMILLIFNFSKDKDKFSSASFMFVTNILGSLPFIFFCSILYNSSFKESVVDMSISSFFLLLSCYLILICKVPVFFAHFWLTKAHVSASGASSMILASLMLKIGTLGLLNFCFLFLSKCAGVLFSFVGSVSVLGCFFMGLAMMRFFDIKYMVACSSIAHMALIFPSALIPQSSSFLGSFLMMVGHGLISCVVFYLVTVLYECGFNRSSDSSKGSESLSSVLMLFLFFFFLLNMGFPPFISFLSEFIFISLFSKTSFFLFFIFSISLMLSGLVFMFMVLTFLFGKGLKKWSGYSFLSTFGSLFVYTSVVMVSPVIFC